MKFLEIGKIIHGFHYFYTFYTLFIYTFDIWLGTCFPKHILLTYFEIRQRHKVKDSNYSTA